MLNTKKNSRPISIKEEKKSLIRRSFPLLEISPLCFLTIILAIFTNYYKYIFIFYLIALIHELSHIFVALIFKRKINKIRMLPFGFYADIEGIEELEIFKEILIYLAGPLSYFLSYFCLIGMLKINFISSYSFYVAQNSNKIMALFNLIPYYPLDGSKIIDTFLGRIFLEKKARIIRIILSATCLIFIIKILLESNQLLLVIYLLLALILEIILFKKKYYAFLIKRLFGKKPKKIKITDKEDISRYYKTYCVHNKNIIDENKIIIKVLQKKKSQKQ